MEELLGDHEHIAPGLLEPQTDNVNPVTLPCYFTISHAENCEQAHHDPVTTLPHLAFKSDLPESSGSARLLGHEPPISSHVSTINLSPPNSNVSVWPHCVSDTQTCPK